MRRSLLCALAAATVLACGASDSTAANGGAAGTWVLQSANGQALPYFEFTGVGGGNVYVTNDTLVVTSGGNFTEHGVRKAGSSPSALLLYDTYAFTGAYTAVSNSLAFVFQGGATGTGTLSGNQLSVTFNGAAFVYQRL